MRKLLPALLLSILLVGAAEAQWSWRCPQGGCPPVPQYRTIGSRLVSPAPESRGSSLRGDCQNVPGGIPATPFPSVVKLQVQNHSASGVIVGADGTVANVVTVAHIFKYLRSPVVQVEIRDGRRLKGRLEECDYAVDLAIVVMPDPGIPPLPIVSEIPAVGTVAFGGGFGDPRRESFQWRSGRITSTVSGYGVSAAGSQVELACGSRHGDSGGPIVNATGYLIGVVASTNHRDQTAGPCLPRLRSFLRRFCIYKRPKPPAATPDPPNLKSNPCPIPLPDTSIVGAGPGGLPERVTAIEAKLLEIERRLAKLEGRPAPGPGPAGNVGPRGSPGPEGPRGLQGEQGLSGDVDLNTLAARVVDRLPPRRYQAKNPDGTLRGPVVEKLLGEVLYLKSVPVE